MSRSYRLTPEARQQVDAIGDFVGQESIDAALRIHDALEEAFTLLAENPGIGHTRQDLTDRPVKFWKVFSYLVIYDSASVPLTIVAVLHGARDLEQILKTV